MRTDIALAMLREAMDNHPELDFWGVALTDRKTVAGECNYNKKTISLSRPFVEINSPETVMQTIIHEIAHALLPPGLGHGDRWRRLAVSLGMDPSRGATVSIDQVNVPKALWEASCRRGHAIGGMHRRPRAQYACRICSKEFNDQTPLVYTNTRTGEVFTV